MSFPHLCYPGVTTKCSSSIASDGRTRWPLSAEMRCRPRCRWVPSHFGQGATTTLERGIQIGTRNSVIGTEILRVKPTGFSDRFPDRFPVIPKIIRLLPSFVKILYSPSNRHLDQTQSDATQRPKWPPCGTAACLRGFSAYEVIDGAVEDNLNNLGWILSSNRMVMNGD